VLVSTVAPDPDAFARLFLGHGGGGAASGGGGAREAEETEATPLGGHAAVAAADAPPAIAWSLHAALASTRKYLVPTATHNPIALRAGLVAALGSLPAKRRRVVVEVCRVGQQPSIHLELHCSFELKTAPSISPAMVVHRTNDRRVSW